MIVKIYSDTGKNETIAGTLETTSLDNGMIDGIGSSAKLNIPVGLTLNEAKNELYVIQEMMQTTAYFFLRIINLITLEVHTPWTGLNNIGYNKDLNLARNCYVDQKNTPCKTNMTEEDGINVTSQIALTNPYFASIYSPQALLAQSRTVQDAWWSIDLQSTRTKYKYSSPIGGCTIYGSPTTGFQPFQVLVGNGSTYSDGNVECFRVENITNNPPQQKDGHIYYEFPCFARGRYLYVHLLQPGIITLMYVYIYPPLSSELMFQGLISVGSDSNSIWIASIQLSTIIQLNLTSLNVTVQYGTTDVTRPWDFKDDLLGGIYHTEKFYQLSYFSVWSCNRPGYDCISNPDYALVCKQGTFSNGVSPCLSCPAGTYSQNQEASSCLQCDFPNYTVSVKSTSCQVCKTDCDSQYRGDCGGASQGTCQSCQPCPAGQRRAQCANFSSGACEPCPNLPAPHQYYVANPECGVSACTNPLPAGNYWSLTGWTSATNCSYAPCSNKPANSSYPAFNNLNSVCKYACDPGYTGAACQPCAQGYYAPFSDSQQCYPCPEGTFAAGQASSACTSCQPGNFAPLQNSTQCLPCPNGTAAPYQQAHQCSPCQPGSVAQQGSSACTACTPGYYADQSSLAACLPCAQGFFTAGPQTACDTCAEGQFAMSQAGPCASCLQGQFSQASSTACSTCPPFTFAQVPSGGCTQCVQGTHYPLHAVLLNTTGNAACDFRCAENYTETFTAQSAMCIQLDPAMKSFLFEAYVQQATLTQAQIQEYQAIIAQALGVREISEQAMGINQSYVFVNFRSNSLQSVVQAPSEQAAVLLAGQVYTSLFQQNINQAVQAKGLASAIVISNSLRYLFAYSPSTTPPPTIPISITNVSFSASARQRAPSNGLACAVVLATLLTINFIQ